MPTKRLSPSSDYSDVAEMPLKRTQRTHEENQERAYIAASRRADRDIEHRIRSALKASECRKKRTGRGLKITREAVLGDEQYESEDDDPTTRRYSMPASTLSNPYLAQTTGADRYAEVDALFAKHFPHVQLSSSRWPGSPQATSHRHSYPQPLHLQSSFAPRYQQDTPVAHASPLLTPPVSYPLPPNSDDTKSRSMSPLALEASSRPSSALPATAAAQRATLGLNLALTDPAAAAAAGSVSAGEYLMPDSADTEPHHAPLFEPAAYIYPPPAGDPSWYDLPPPTTATSNDTSTTASTGSDASTSASSTSTGSSGWHHSRSLSLPSSLAQFSFAFSSDADAESSGASNPSPDSDLNSNTKPNPDTNTDKDLMSSMLVDPNILLPVDGGGSGRETPLPNEPWADWVNLDGPGPGEGVQPQVLGVQV